MLDGDFTTPLGAIPKKTAAIGGVILLIAAVVIYRKSQAQTATAASTSTDSTIDPATGFPYGSNEDAAALAAQANSSALTPDGSVGSGGLPPAGTGYTSNAQWEQAVISIMTANGTLTDPTAMSTALGAYLTGSPAGDSTTTSLIEQAIATAGYPPVSGSNGYPPSINTSSGVPTTPPPTPTPTPTPSPSQPTYANVYKGGLVNAWVSAQPTPGADFNAKWQQLMDWNTPGIGGNVDTSNPDYNKRTWRHDARYRVT